MSTKFPDDNNNQKGVLESVHYEVQESFPFAQLARPLHAANCSEYAVAHSNISLQPARQVGEISFLPHILYAMRRLRLTKLLRVQSYAWPYLRQGSDNGAVIVSAPRSGRTLSYVPPLCQVVCTTMTEQRCLQCWELQGPIALVLAADLKRVQQIAALCNTMLRKARNEEWLSLVLTVPSADSPEFLQRWLNGVGCVVATPAQFLWLRSYDMLKLPGLRFVAYDDVDLMSMEQLQQAHQHLFELTKKHRPQLVIISQSYNPKLLHMLREFNDHSMLLFGDILEAALYGGVKMRMSLLKSRAKDEELLQLLLERSPQKLRTVINCQTDEDIKELVQLLSSNGYKCLPYYHTADLAVRDHVHRWMQHTGGELLLHTDECPELDIRHAHTLIHYSISDSWSKFKLRHLALADNLRNQFALKATEEVEMDQGSDKDSEQDRLLSLVFLDETNNKQLPRLVDFLSMHQQVEERIKNLVRRIRDELESLKRNEPVLCDLLLSLGHCGDTLCAQRHQLLPHDRQLPPWMPSSGDVKLQLVRVYSPTHYCVRLLEHLPSGGKWTPVSRSATLEMKLQLLQAQQCLRHWPPKPKDICTYRNDYGYERVRILNVAPIERVNLSQLDVEVEVQAMDIDTRLIKTNSGKLYICPEELQSAPPLAMDLRIVGMVPFTGERSWHEADGHQCADWLSAVPQPNFLQAKIVRSLSHTIFVSNLVATSYAPSLQMHVRLFNMCQQLTSHKLAKKCEETVKRLMDFLPNDVQNGLEGEVKIESKQMDEETHKKLESEEQQSKGQQSEEQQSKEQETQEQETQEQETKEQTCKETQHEQKSPSKLFKGSSRLSFFAKMAQQMGKENQLCLEMKQQQLNQLDANQNTQGKKDPDNSIAALCNCLMMCSLLDRQEQQEQEKQQAQHKQQTLTDNSISPAALLEQLIEPQQELSIKQQQVKPVKTPTKSTIESPKKNTEIQYGIPANVVRPEVIYYQTLSTLELQVILPEDRMSYEAALLNGSCIMFWTTQQDTTESISYQFTVNTHCAYQSLQHHVQGRTVYLSVLKALAIQYPLEFGFYKFMKPQHEKLNSLENKRLNRVADFERYLRSKDYIQGGSVKYTNDEDEMSSDDQAEEWILDARGERVERPFDPNVDLNY